MQRCPNGTPLSPADADLNRTTTISVVSWNLLAPAYVRPVDLRTGDIQAFAAFEWVKDDSVLDWSLRRQRILTQLTFYQADVICLQELQLERRKETNVLEIPEWMQPLQEDYQIQLPPNEELEVIAARNLRVLGVDAAVTCAILFRRDKWKLVTPLVKQDVVLNTKESADHNRKQDTSNEDTNTCVSVCLCLSERRFETNQPTIVISSVHLDAMDEKKRVGTLSRRLRRARSLLDASNAHEEKSSMPPLTTIIAGDMNSEFWPGSCVAAF